MRLFHSRARLGWADGDWEQGRAYAERTIALLDTSEDVQDLIRMHLLRAGIALLTGDLNEAEVSVREAKGVSGRIRMPRTLRRFASSRRRLLRVGTASRRAILLAEEAIELLEQDPASQGRAYGDLVRRSPPTTALLTRSRCSAERTS